jgi:hypothetical protein
VSMTKFKDYINRGIVGPNNYHDIDYTGYEAYEEYIAWSKFTKSFPYNTELLIKLFGERDAMQVFRHMNVLPETKARELVERLRYTVVHKKKLKNMSDS